MLVRGYRPATAPEDGDDQPFEPCGVLKVVTFRAPVWVFVLIGCVTSPPVAEPAQTRAVVLPAVAWSPERVAQHLLNRLAFGPSVEDRAAVARVGPAEWIRAQLVPGRDEAMEARLAGFKTLSMGIDEAYRAYPPLQKRAKAEGVAKEDFKQLASKVRDELPRQVVLEATQARLLRAASSHRQLEEVLVDFWFNHFNVSAEKGRTRWMVSAYERDAIRPHVLGRFRELLGATAKHPAMLFYLDNWLSTREGFDLEAYGRSQKIAGAGKQTVFGLNENYARELMELHTVGVGAGYSQDDVREAARALTGWSLELREKSDDFGAFVYRDLTHDKGAKNVFGLALPAGGRQDDGERLLDFLARHPATAKFLALKLCRRFVSDSPPPALVERVAAEFLRTDGDLTATYLAIFTAPELWTDAVYAAKTKTPFEFIVSAVRATGTLESAELPLGQALDALGMPLYRAQPPTGYGETAEAWVNAGALVSRINFGLKLAQGRVRGVKLELPTVSGGEDAVIDALALQLLGSKPTAPTRATLKAALGASDEEALEDGERRKVDVGKVAGLLLGSPEFQKQ